MTTQPERNTEICCDVFERLVSLPEFNWMSFFDDKGKKTYLMPYFKPNLRINYCPSCGKYVRDVEISEQKMTEIMNR